MSELGGLILFGIVAVLVVCCVVAVVYCGCAMIYIRMTRPAKPLSNTEASREESELQV